MAEEKADVTVDLDDDGIAMVQIHRPPANFFDVSVITELCVAYESLDDNPTARVIVLCSEGKHFCAGANHADDGSAAPDPMALYAQAVRLFSSTLPVVAAVQGAAIGGGLGLALSADFRVVGEDSRLAANFALLGLHKGFGVSVTLPAVIGEQRALQLLYTGRRIGGNEAFHIGLADRLAPDGDVLSAAHDFAAEIATSAPLAVRSIRKTMRGHLAEAVERAMELELREQRLLRATEDFTEGIRASAERRAPHFQGR